MTQLLAERLHIKVTADQLARWHQVAQADGRTLAGWVRWVLDQAASRFEADRDESAGFGTNPAAARQAERETRREG